MTDLLINGDGSIWVDRDAPRAVGGAAARRPVGAEVRGPARRRSPPTARRLHALCRRTAGRGIRFHAVLAPIATDGAHVSLRIPRRTALDLATMERDGSVSADHAAELRGLVADRRSVLVTGGTGTGKTTLLAAVLAEVAAKERLVVVEDVSELHIPHPHVVRLQSRHRNVEGAGEVTLTELVRQALRMRPDRLVVGEVRGAEVIDLLRAFNTGHEGGWATVHANSAHDVMARLEALGSLAGLPGEAVRSQARAAVDAVVHLERVDGRRRVREIVHWGPQPARSTLTPLSPAASA